MNHKTTLNPIITAVERATGINRRLILGRDRKWSSADARQILHVLVYDETKSFAESGRMLNRDHATIIWSVKQVRNKRETEVEFARKFERALEELRK
jgi:chromosomal replication initiation ATPase DnaA